MTTLTPAEASDRFRSEPDRWIDVDNGALAYRRIGTGPDVFFVHGWPVSGATWRTLLPHLAEHVTCHVIDLVGAGDSRFDRSVTIDLAHHVSAIERAVDELGLDDVAVVGHDSGGMMARHALAGDDRVRSWGLVDTEPPGRMPWRFASFVYAGKYTPRFGRILAWAATKPAVRRNKFVLGDAFADRSLLDGEFDEFFLRPLQDPERQWAADQLISDFDFSFVRDLERLHRKIEVPVQLVWGEDDPFFPVPRAREMVDTFADAQLHVVPGAKLFVHEEKPAEVAAALLPTLLGNRADS